MRAMNLTDESRILKKGHGRECRYTVQRAFIQESFVLDRAVLEWTVIDGPFRRAEMIETIKHYIDQEWIDEHKLAEFEQWAGPY